MARDIITQQAVVLVLANLFFNSRIRVGNGNKSRLNILTKPKTSIQLGEEYLREGVVGKTSRTDCRHIALATLVNADILVSWNFKHIVNIQKIRGYNSVNIKYGHRILEIRTPREILEL